MSVTFNNTTFGALQSMAGAVTGTLFTGTAALSSTAPVTIDGTIDTPGSTAAVSLTLANAASVTGTGTYLGFSTADANGNFVYYFSVVGTGIVDPLVVAVTPATTLPVLSVGTTIDTSVTTAPVCFVSGTRIRTMRGEIKVEDLEVGDMAATASGAYRPIVWIGHRKMDLTGAANRDDALPIRIRASAIAMGVPARDLVVSPGHRLFLDGVLVQACHLVNDRSIVRDETDRMTYWHVELDSHDILIAENVPTESYVEAANRSAFANGEVVFGNRPVVSLALSKPLCADLVDSGPRLDAIRARLLSRAIGLGATWWASDDFAEQDQPMRRVG